MKIEKVTLSSSNSKLGAIYSISLPAIETCRADAPCKSGCYATKGTFCYNNVKSAYQKNKRMFEENMNNFKQSIISQLPFIGVVRWHVSGDIMSMDYLNTMCEIAKAKRGVKFLAFTKKYELINEYLESKKLPSNLKIVYSGWKGLEIPNPYNMPIAWMLDEKDVDERIPLSALPCSGHCVECGVCWSLRKRQSVVFHKH